MKTAMQELLAHLVDAWSSPGDLWNPAKIIEKVESMLPKERLQIEEAYEQGDRDGGWESSGIYRNYQHSEDYFTQKYGQ